MSAVEAAVADALAALTAAYGFALARTTPNEAPLLAIALSGGLDSTVLLDAFARALAPSQLLALHVHHGLSADADSWLRHAEQESHCRGIRFLAQRVDLTHLGGQGIEAAARVARYRALTQMAEQAGARVLLVAHHADDQAETVLLQLLRGAGLAGVAAMPRERFADTASAALRLYRPFLHLTRAHLELYAARHGLNWINDESNEDVRFARNALRRDVLPQIDSYFPAYRQTLARFARHAGTAQSLCDDLAAIDWHRCVRVPADTLGSARPHSADTIAAPTTPVAAGSPAASLPRDDAAEASIPAAAVSVLSRAQMQALSADRLSNLLRFWIRQQGLPAASAGRLAEMVRQLREAPTATVDGARGGVREGARDGAQDGAHDGAHNGADDIVRCYGRVSIAHADRVLRGYRDHVFWTDAATASVAPGARSPSTLASSSSEAEGDAVDGTEAPVLAYPGGAVWALPRWHGELRIVDVRLDDGRSAATGADDGSLAQRPMQAPNAAMPPPLALRLPADWQRYGVMHARARQGGERLRLGVDRPARSLKQHFQQAGVPVWLRDVPLFYVDDRLIFVPHVGGHWPFTLDVGVDRGNDAVGSAAVQTGATGEVVLLYWHPWPAAMRGDHE